MTIAYWILAALVALAFIAAGSMKLLRPKDQLAAAGMAWTEDFSGGTVKLIGALELVGGLGVILPAITGIAPVLSPVAATCLAIVMVAAIVVHVRRKEAATPALVLLILSAAAAVLGFLRLG